MNSSNLGEEIRWKQKRGRNYWQDNGEDTENANERGKYPYNKIEFDIRNKLKRNSVIVHRILFDDWILTKNLTIANLGEEIGRKSNRTQQKEDEESQKCPQPEGKIVVEQQNCTGIRTGRNFRRHW